MTTTGDDAPTEIPLHEALRVWPRGEGWEAEVHPGWDIFGIPHGGYLAALAANAALVASGAPDVLSITTHYLAKASDGPMRLAVRPVGGGRRLTTLLVEASQGERTTMAALASVGDRTTFDGPAWDQRTAPELAGRLGGRAGDPDQPFDTPGLARRLGMRLDQESAAFARGEPGDRAVMRARIDPPVPTPTDQLLALVTCDATPPAAWNALGMTGWVPTVELTAHVRARPSPGPLSVVAETRSVSEGLLEEDAEVFDETGRLVVLARQLARWSEAG